MPSKNEGVDQQGSPSNNRSSISNPFTENSRQGYMGPEVGRAQNENLQDQLIHNHNHPHPHPASLSYDMQAILREIERERIRDEIILAEMARRRAIELEVRIELLKQTESALQRGSSSTGFPFGSSQVLGLDSPLRLLLPSARAEGRSLEERISLLNEGRPNGRREGGGFEMPFQRGTAKPVQEEGKKKDNIILLGKPKVNIMSGSKQEAETPSEVNVSGSKRKAETPPPPEVDVSEQPSEDILQKKAKTEWGCDLCPVFATSEKSLSEHLQGKKHKAKEARLRAQRAGKKNYGLGLFPKEDTEPIEVVETDDPGRDDGVKIVSLKGDERNPNSDDMKNQSEIIVPEEQKNGGKLRLWCNLCRVGNFSQDAMNEHEKGKKHVKRLRESEQKPIEKIVVGLSRDEEAVAENENPIDDVLSEVRSAYLGLTDAALKPEDPEQPEDESKSKDIGALEPEHVDETKEENGVAVAVAVDVDVEVQL